MIDVAKIDVRICAASPMCTCPDNPSPADFKSSTIEKSVLRETSNMLWFPRRLRSAGRRNRSSSLTKTSGFPEPCR